MLENIGNKELWVVTNRNLIKNDTLCNVLERCMKFNIDKVVLREKDLSNESLLALAKEVKGITDKYNIPLIINNDLSCALKVDADGFHTSFENFKTLLNKNQSSESIKYLLDKKNFKIGISIHSVEEAIESEKLGADYIFAGHVFETNCKKGLKGRGIEFINQVCKSVNIPVIAIGGINDKNVNLLSKTKITGIAIMSLAMEI